MQPDSSIEPSASAPLRGEIALVTGGGSGIGLATAKAFVRAGARVAITGRTRGPLDEAVHALGDHAWSAVHDVTDFAGAERLIAEITVQWDAPTIIVHNAGLHLKKPAADVSMEEFQAVLNVHVLGAHALSRAVLPGMCRRGKGSLLFIASMASLIGLPLVVAYAAAKSAHLGMVRTLASEYGKHGVRVNAIAPGWIRTPMMEQALAKDTARQEKILSRTPLQRFGEVDEIADAAVFLSSPSARFITGAILPVDGGASIGF